MTETLLNRPIAIFILFFTLSALGVIAVIKSPISLLPDVAYPSIFVQTEYKQASPDDIEKLITEPLERELSTIKDLKHIRSFSKQGISIIQLYFNWGSSMTEAQLAVRDRIAKARNNIVPEAKEPNVFQVSPSSIPLVKLAVISDSQSILEITEYSETILKRRFEQLDGLALAQVQGGEEKIVEIRLDLNKCERYDIQISDISNTIQSNNIRQDGGIVRDGQFRLSMKMKSNFENLIELENLAIVNRDGQMILLKQIATINFNRFEHNASVFF
jgi:hydrophobic/amphiphilic exporter-1 (mainly G- bacteria), HAE1 family